VSLPPQTLGYRTTPALSPGHPSCSLVKAPSRGGRGKLREAASTPQPPDFVRSPHAGLPTIARCRQPAGIGVAVLYPRHVLGQVATHVRAWDRSLHRMLLTPTAPSLRPWTRGLGWCCVLDSCSIVNLHVLPSWLAWVRHHWCQPKSHVPALPGANCLPTSCVAYPLKNAKARPAFIDSEGRPVSDATNQDSLHLCHIRMSAGRSLCWKSQPSRVLFRVTERRMAESERALEVRQEDGALEIKNRVWEQAEPAMPPSSAWRELCPFHQVSISRAAGELLLLP